MSMLCNVEKKCKKKKPVCSHEMVIAGLVVVCLVYVATVVA